MRFWKALSGIEKFIVAFLFFGILGFFYQLIFTCNTEFEEYSDGWYVLIDKGEMDSKGNWHENLEPLDGPYTEVEVDSIIKDCKSLYYGWRNFLH